MEGKEITQIYNFQFRDSTGKYYMVKGTKLDDDEGEEDTLTVANYEEMSTLKAAQYLQTLYNIQMPASYSPMFNAVGTGASISIFSAAWYWYLIHFPFTGFK